MPGGGGSGGLEESAGQVRAKRDLPLFLTVALGTPPLVALGFALCSRLLLPLLSVAAFYPAMVVLLRRRRRGRAVALGLIWALVLGLSSTVMCAACPERAARVVWHGQDYWEEMAPWVETGEGRESRPSQFIPQHALHLALFCVLALATGGFLAVLMGAALMNYMSFYVGALALRAESPLLVALLGWHPWSLVRIAAFVVLGVVLSEPLLRRLWGRPFQGWRPMPWLVGALGGLVADAVIKALLAPHWAGVLRSLLALPLD